MNKPGLIQFTDREGNVTFLRNDVDMELSKMKTEFQKVVEADPHLKEMKDLSMEFIEWAIHKQYLLIIEDAAIKGK